MNVTPAELVAYGFGGLTLPVAIYLVLQALKRNHPAMAGYMPELVIAIAMVLVLSASWLPKLFMALAGTIVLAAVILTAHGGIKNAAGPKEPKPPS